MKKFFQANCNNWSNYDPVSRRGNVEPDFSFIDKVAATTKPTVSKDSVAKGSVLSKQKSILAPKALGSRVDSLNTSKYTGGSNSNSGSTTNLFANLSNKENELLADINAMMEKQKTADKSPQIEVLKAERDFYYFKLRDIDHILDVYKDSSVETLINNIREILYMTPEKIAIVLEDGNIKIKNKNEEELKSGEQSAEKAHPQKDEISEEIQEQMKQFENNMNIEDENLLV
jgi:Microtubule-binding protein involved in cell cycle control